MRTVGVRLDSPPQVASAGLNVHGILGPRDVWRLPDLWQLHLYRYSAELTVCGTTHPIRPGYVSLIPPATEVVYRYRGRSEHLYAHLRLPQAGASRTLPLMQDAGGETPMLSGLLLHAIAAAPGSPIRASAEVWAVLWHIAGLARPSGSGGQHAAVATAIAYIESNLVHTLTVAQVARVAGVSHNHLTRLFRAETGSTVVAYIRRRRLARARHLLRESTLSIPAIAAAVGIADLQAFNKACHRELGASPRAVRAADRNTRLTGSSA
jgi:AraC family transcriptional regulator